MKLDTAFEDVPDDDDLLYSIEHWDSEEVAERDGGSADEAFVHPRTGTAARIMHHDDGYSVQTAMGDYADFDNVVQSDDPTTFVSGGSSVVMMELESLGEARAVAYSWMRGWVMRNGAIGDEEGDIIDSEA